MIRALFKHGSGVLGMLLFGVLVFMALFAPFITRHPPERTNFQTRNQPPSLQAPMGTDNLGRNVFERVVWGARLSIASGLGALAVGGVLGVAIGLLAGYVGGITDRILMRVIDVLLAFPTLLMALIVVSILGPGALQTVLAIGFAMVASFARLARGEALRVREWDFVQGARAVGAGNWRIVLRHVLPNMISPILVYATLRFGVVILTEASLSFLSLGPSSPSPAWGLMVNEGLRSIRTAWWIAVMPGVAILFTVLAANLLGDALRDVLDPRTTSTRRPEAANA